MSQKPNRKEKLSTALQVTHLWAGFIAIVVILAGVFMPEATGAGDDPWGYYLPFLVVIAFCYVAIIIGTFLANYFQNRER
jgi:fucose permease